MYCHKNSHALLSNKHSFLNVFFPLANCATINSKLSAKKIVNNLRDFAQISRLEYTFRFQLKYFSTEKANKSQDLS